MISIIKCFIFNYKIVSTIFQYGLNTEAKEYSSMVTIGNKTRLPNHLIEIPLEIQLLFHHNENTRLVDTFSKLSRKQRHVSRYFAQMRDRLYIYMCVCVYTHIYTYVREVWLFLPVKERRFSFSRDPVHKETR